MIAYIQFKDGTTHPCTGKVKGGTPTYPGIGVPWESEDEVRRHCAANGLILLRIWRVEYDLTKSPPAVEADGLDE